MQYDSLTEDGATGPYSERELRETADRVLFAHEFAVAYEEPIAYGHGRGDGWLTGWVRDVGPDGLYRREQLIHVDDVLALDWFEDMASDPERIEGFLQKEH
jgi:hypothetical protein